jgi:hypothetical protein
MDSEGYVYLDEVANFRRIACLMAPPALVSAVSSAHVLLPSLLPSHRLTLCCIKTQILEAVHGSDNLEVAEDDEHGGRIKVRCAVDPLKWVATMQ